MGDAGDEFWAFSLAFYGRPEVAAACLALQDRHGRDVNLVLYLCWLGLSGRGRLGSADLAQAEAAIAPWRQSRIEPLRAARRALKGAEDAARYEAAKAAELEAEREAQRRLAALAPAPSQPLAATAATADAAANLALYLDDDARRSAAPLLAALASVVGPGDASA